METIENMRWGTKAGRTGDELNSSKGKQGFQITTGSAVSAQKLIGERECFCVQFCELPDIFCGECHGTGEVKRLQEHLTKYGMRSTTKRKKRVAKK